MRTLWSDLVSKIGVWGEFWGVGSTFEPGDLFVSKMRAEKDGFVEE